MISQEELTRYARLTRLNLGQAEISYFQNIVLFIFYKSVGRELVFKGGTALNRCYGLDRFSKDLDFTFVDGLKLKDILVEGLKDFLIDFELEEKAYREGIKFTLRIKGPLYIGIRRSLCHLEIDISQRENILLETELKTIGRFLEEIPIFDVVVMKEEEILAEKIRAIMTRTYARDLHDLWFLIKKDVQIDLSLVNKKLNFYGEEFSFKKFRAKVMEKKKIWDTELKPLLPRVVGFAQVKKEVFDKLY